MGSGGCGMEEMRVAFRSRYQGVAVFRPARAAVGTVDSRGHRPRTFFGHVTRKSLVLRLAAHAELIVSLRLSRLPMPRPTNFDLQVSRMPLPQP